MADNAATAEQVRPLLPGTPAVFSWSTAPCPSARAFRLLGLHAGPDISMVAAAALIGVPLARALAALSNGHLLEETHRGRYRFHDLLRVYAAECAQGDEPEQARIAAVRRLLSGTCTLRLGSTGSRSPVTCSTPGASSPPVLGFG